VGFHRRIPDRNQARPRCGSLRGEKSAREQYLNMPIDSNLFSSSSHRHDLDEWVFLTSLSFDLQNIFWRTIFLKNMKSMIFIFVAWRKPPKKLQPMLTELGDRSQARPRCGWLRGENSKKKLHYPLKKTSKNQSLLQEIPPTRTIADTTRTEHYHTNFWINGKTSRSVLEQAVGNQQTTGATSKQRTTENKER